MSWKELKCTIGVQSKIIFINYNFMWLATKIRFIRRTTHPCNKSIQTRNPKILKVLAKK
jgi:hypothetical protein